MSTITKCRFYKCGWIGSVDDVFPHVELCHPTCIRENKDNGYYDFQFEDLASEAFLLSGPNGIYWYCLDVYNEEKSIKRGVFHIGDSEPIEYTVKLGLIRDGHAEYLGPHTSRSAEFEATEFDMDLDFAFIEFINDELKTRIMRLYVGDYDDSEDIYSPDFEEIVWTPEEEEANRICLEQLVCGICLEYVRQDARFCERKHFVCLKCFLEMEKRRQLRCPVCRGDYLFDCHDENVERVLRMIKFPKEEANQEEPGCSTSKGK